VIVWAVEQRSEPLVLHPLQLLDAVVWKATEHSLAVVDPREGQTVSKCKFRGQQDGECVGQPVRGSTIVPPSRRASGTSDVDRARLPAPSYRQLLADQLLPRTQTARITSPHAVDWSFWRSELLTRPGSAVDCSAGTTVWCRWYTRRARTAELMCCRHAQRDGVACRRRIGGTARRGER